VDELYSRITRSLCVYTPQYLDRCRQRTLEPPYKPQTWEDDSSFFKFCLKSASQIVSKLEDADVGQSCSQMKSYLLSSKIARMLLQADELSHLEIPHDVSAEEKFLIEYSEGSLFVLGRSGTGKTTVYTFAYRF
jgi:hypothetical protein